MWVKRQRVKGKNGKVYRYAYLTESYRDEQGRSRHRNVANLTGLSELQLDNLELGLQAGARGQAVVVADDAAHAIAKVSASHRYLDIATLLELWREWGLDQLCDDVMPRAESSVAPGDVVVSLVLQRAIDPDSKLAAVDWFAKTALPQLLGVTPATFHNTRIHRVLEQLDASRHELQARLASRCHDRRGHFLTLFLDGTDTFFIGRGPSLAARGKTKEGRLEFKLGIILLCNERGEPLRWKVVAGNSAESKDFHRLYAELKVLSWAQEVPIVVDRIMGHTADIEAMASTGLHFVTALTAIEYDTYAPELPRAEVGSASLQLRKGEAFERADCERLIALVQPHGFQLIDDQLLIRDLGVRKVRVAEECATGARRQESLREALETGHELRTRLESGELHSHSHASRVYNMSPSWVGSRVSLSRLAPVIQDDILAGHAEHLALRDVRRLVSQPLEEQTTLYFELKARCRGKRTSSRQQTASTRDTDSQTTEVRQVLYFSPKLHLHKRRKLLERIGKVRSKVEQLNDALLRACKPLSQERCRAQLQAKLTKLSLARAFEVLAAEDGTVQLVENTEYLTHLRGRFGFCVVVAHRDTVATALELVRCYRSKNTIERDFRIIKSCVELRPIRHRVLGKVRAHVTLCMLALLLHRSLEARLDDMHMSSERALAELECPLNYFGSLGVHTITTPNRTQRKILEQLGLQELIDDQEIARRLRPRARQ